MRSGVCTLAQVNLVLDGKLDGDSLLLCVPIL